MMMKESVMVNQESHYTRGSEWRQWDLHVHTPASFEWNGGKRFIQMTEIEKSESVDKMINALNKAEPTVFVLMDYWNFDGWFALKKRLAEEGAPILNKKVFPGIELRLVSPTPYRLNAHVMFSDDVSNQDLLNFKGKLEVALINQPLSDECLIRLAREKVGEDKLNKIGVKASDVAIDDELALLAGSKIAEIVADKYKEAINKVPKGKAIYVTTQTLSRAQLDALSEAIGDECTLLVCCDAFRVKRDAFANLTLKKIPNAVLNRCEFGRDDYSLEIVNLPDAPIPPGAQATLFVEDD
jgi:hypothetical protein